MTIDPAAVERSRVQTDPAPPRARSRVVLGGLAVCGILFCLGAWFHAGPFEDSYITYRIAGNLAEGQGPVFNPGERVEGYTTFLWLVILAGAHRIGLPIPATADLLGVVAGLLLLVTTYFLGRRSGLSRGWALAPVLFLAVNPDLALWAGSGMETALFALLTAGTLLAYLAAPERYLAQGVLATCTSLVRPDGVLVALAVGVSRLLDRRPLRETAAFAATFGALFGCYFAWRWSYFGWFWPNTFYAKVGSTAALVPLGLEQLLSWFRMFGTWLLLPALILLAIRRQLGRAERLLAVLTLLTLLYVVGVGGDIFEGYRFFVTILAPTYILLARGGLAAVPPPSRRPAAATAGVVLGILFALYTATAFRSRRGDWGPPSMLDFLRAKQGITRQYLRVAGFIRENFDEKTTLALNAVGVIPQVTGLHTYDMLGLTDEHIAHRPAEIGKEMRGHEKHDAAYILSREPDVIVLGFPMLTREPLPPDDLSEWAAYFRLPGDAEMVRDPRLAKFYLAASVALGDDGYFNFLVNRRTIHLRDRSSAARDHR